MYNQEWWNSLTKQQQIVTVANTIRGSIINAFVAIESIIADINIVVNNNSDFKTYYKGFKSTKSIIEDFCITYDKIQAHADKYFLDKSSLKGDLEYLADIRNRAAHFQWLNDEYALDHSSPLDKIYFYSIRYSKNDCCVLSRQLVYDYQQVIMLFLQRFIALQADIYATYKNLPDTKTAKELVDNHKVITVDRKFESLK